MRRHRLALHLEAPGPWLMLLEAPRALGVRRDAGRRRRGWRGCRAATATRWWCSRAWARRDLTTLPLRHFLRERGYTPIRLEPGLQLRPAPRRARQLPQRSCSRLADPPRRTRQPDRLEPGRHLRARDRQGAARARRAASSRWARRSPATRAPPTPGASTRWSAARRCTTTTLLAQIRRPPPVPDHLDLQRAATASSPGIAA